MSQKERYRSLKEIHHELPVFFLPWWLDAVSGKWDVAIAESNGAISGVLPYSIDKRMGLTIIRNPQLTPYLGPYFFYPLNKSALGRQEFENDIFEQLWQQLPGWDSFDAECAVCLDNSSLFADKGFSIVERPTYELNLHAEEGALFSGMHANHRNLIRRAGETHDIIEGIDGLERLIELHRNTFTRKGKKYMYAPRVIEELVKQSYLNNSGAVFSARNKEHILTAVIFTVWDARRMYLLVSTVDTGRAHQGAVRLLIWHAIRYARDKGLPFFDFEGSSDPGIASFFKRFGGERKSYLCVHKNNSAIWRLKQKLVG